MSALFRPWTTTAFRIALLVLVGGATATLGGFMVYVRTPYFTNQQNEVEQPVQFDHRHHVADDGIDCRYCHNMVEKSSTAGLPSSSVCMGCHAQIWNKSPLLDPVRKSFFTGKSIRWVRIHNLPDFVYFNHAIHVGKGIGCAECHGRVDRMPTVAQVSPLTMSWCLECHRNPIPRLRPKEEITNMAWTAGAAGDALVLQRTLYEKYEVHPRTSCTTCHR